MRSAGFQIQPVTPVQHHCTYMHTDLELLVHRISKQACKSRLAVSLWSRDVRRSFNQGVVCGYVSKGDHSLHLNPADHQKLEWGDRLIVLANDGTALLTFFAQCSVALASYRLYTKMCLVHTSHNQLESMISVTTMACRQDNCLLCVFRSFYNQVMGDKVLHAWQYLCWRGGVPQRGDASLHTSSVASIPPTGHQAADLPPRWPQHAVSYAIS